MSLPNKIYINLNFIDSFTITGLDLWKDEQWVQVKIEDRTLRPNSFYRYRSINTEQEDLIFKTDNFNPHSGIMNMLTKITYLTELEKLALKTKK